MNNYEAKQEAKRERYLELAEKHRKKAEQRHKSFRDISRMIPMGQPILVGHHSEKRHRADLKRMDNHMRKASEHTEKAEYYERKAEAVGKGGISSDDPEAVRKLKAKLEKRERQQEFMKKANRAIRLKDEAKGNERLAEMGLDPAKIQALREPDFAGRVGYPSYMLKNNNANIRRMKKRIEQLKAAAEREYKEIEHGDVTVIQNTDENRLQIQFPGKPSADVRKRLKSFGFRWSRYNMAWQRHLNNAGIAYADMFIKWLNDEMEGEWQ